jgi:hypothetical protein
MNATISTLTMFAIVTCARAVSAQDALPPPVPVVTPPPPALVLTTTDAAPSPAPDAPATVSPINRPLLATSLVLLGGTYLASAVDGATSGRDADRSNLLYPVVGPWMDYANRDCGTPGKCNANEGGYKALLVLGGIGQGLGALGALTSLFLPEKTTRRWYFIGNDTLQAAPSPVGTGYGLVGVGRF